MPSSIHSVSLFVKYHRLCLSVSKYTTASGKGQPKKNRFVNTLSSSASHLLCFQFFARERVAIAKLILTRAMCPFYVTTSLFRPTLAGYAINTSCPISRHDSGHGGDDEAGVVPNVPPDVTAQPPAAAGLTILLRLPEEQRPTHLVLRPATYSAVGQSAEMPDSRSAAVRLSDGERLRNFARGCGLSACCLQRRTSDVFTLRTFGLAMLQNQ